MKFKKAVEKTRPIQDAHRDGLRALRRSDRRRVSVQNGHILSGSIDLDNALKASCPNDPRWDYGIGVVETAARDRVLWIEVHPASSRHIQDVLAKLDWLRAWLSNDAPALRKMRASYIWIASWRVALPAGSPQRRILAQRGLRFAGSQYTISAR